MAPGIFGHRFLRQTQWPSELRLLRGVVGYLAWLATLLILIVIIARTFYAEVAGHIELAGAGDGAVAFEANHGTEEGGPRRVQSLVLGSDDDWMQTVRSGHFWSGKQTSPMSDQGGPRSPTIESHSKFYRTLCVRQCDGYYWPISFATSPASFKRDNETCERSCSSAAKLYVHRNPGEEPKDMVDLKGRPYRSTRAGFRYRVTYDTACQCRPHPWEPEALAQHRALTRVAQPDKVQQRSVTR